jgi:hypothetical protein
LLDEPSKARAHTMSNMADQVQQQWIVSDVGEYAIVGDLHELLARKFSYEYEGQIVKGYHLEVSLTKRVLDFRRTYTIPDPLYWFSSSNSPGGID